MIFFWFPVYYKYSTKYISDNKIPISMIISDIGDIFSVSIELASRLPLSS